MTRALVTFYDASGKVICRLYRNGDGFPWDFGVSLAEFWNKGLNFDGFPGDVEMECLVANCVAEFVADQPRYCLLIAEDIGWGEDYRYDVHKPKDEVLITVSYPTLDHDKKQVTVTPKKYIELIGVRECKAFGPYISAHSVEQRTYSIPNQSAVRTIVPIFPGS